MSGNLIFEKRDSESYNLVFDYTSVLNSGEVIKTYNVYVNDVYVSGLYDSRYVTYELGSGNYDTIFTLDPIKYDNYTVLLPLNSGITNSGYSVNMVMISNKYVEYNKTIDVTIDSTAYPYSYNDFEYRFLVDSGNLFMLPSIYTDHVPFNYNTEYTVNIDSQIASINDLHLLTSETFWFTSKYCPMFTSVLKIKLLLGPEADKFTEDTINRYIHRNSKESIDLVNLNGSTLSYSYYGCTPTDVPYNLSRYVECKTAYDLFNLLDRLRLIDGSAAGQTKKLGDMNIKYNGTSGGNANNNDAKNDLYECFMGLQNMISNGDGSGIRNAVRGKYDTSKGFSHPVLDSNHNRISKPRPTSNGPWYL